MSDTFESAMISAGLEPPHCEPDGEIHRFSSNGKRHDRAGWYVFFGDAGVFGDWRTGFQETWFPPEDETLKERKSSTAKESKTKTGRSAKAGCPGAHPKTGRRHGGKQPVCGRSQLPLPNTLTWIESAYRRMEYGNTGSF